MARPLPAPEEIAPQLAAFEAELTKTTTLNGNSPEARELFRVAKRLAAKEQLSLDAYPLLAEWHAADARRAITEQLGNNSARKPRAAAAAATPKATASTPKRKPAASKPLPKAPKPAAVLGKPLVLRTDLKHADHPTVRFLAAREATDRGAGTLLVCGSAPALAGFDESGELLLVPLSDQGKDGPSPDWGDITVPLERLNVELLAPIGGATQSTEQSLEWINRNTRKVGVARRGSFYYSSAQAVDPITLQTTMGATTARGLGELFLEWDHLSLEQQQEKAAWLKGLGFSLTLVHSGSKSIHCHIHLDRVVPFEESLPLLKLLCALGDGDTVVVSKARAMRLAGAFRPSKERKRGGAQFAEQALIELADHCYDPLEVQRVLEAEAKARGWNLDHLAARWSAYRKAIGQKPETWESALEAWTRPAIEATAWAMRSRSNDDDTRCEPVEWRKEENEIGAKIRRAEAELITKHGLADAYALVAVSGRLEELQVAKGYAPEQFEFGFYSDGVKVKGQSPWSRWRADGKYSGNSLHLFCDTLAFYCWASDRSGKLAEFAAHFCRYPVLEPEAPTEEEQLKIALYLWELAELPADEFETEGGDEEDEKNIHRVEALANYQTARKHRLALADALPNSIAELLTTRAEAFPVDSTMLLPPFFAACAAVMGTRYRVELKKGWTEPMVFWIGTVGEASAAKTPVANQILSPLRKKDHDLFCEWKRECAKADLAQTEKPPLPRKTVASDATVEAIAAHLDDPVNVGIVREFDELVTFIASMDAYRGRGGPSKDRGHWLSLWSGGAIDVMRKGSRVPIIVPETAVSLFGNIQPSKLAELLGSDDAADKSGDGFWARFLWCAPCNPFPKMNRDESDISHQLEVIYDALDNFTANAKVTVRVSDAAWEVFAAQADQWSREAAQCYSARQAVLLKMRGYLARFAGLLHALDHANRIKGPTGGSMTQIDCEIPAATMERAVLLCRWFMAQFDALAPQVGGSADLPAWVVKLTELGETQGTVTARDLVRRKWADSSKRAREMLLAMVQQYELGRLLPSPRKDALIWTPTGLEDAALGD